MPSENVEGFYNRFIPNDRSKNLPDTDRIRQIRSKDNEDARFGHNSCPAIHKSENTYSVTVLNEQNKARLDFESTEEFSRRLEVRYRIEEKN